MRSSTARTVSNPQRPVACVARRRTYARPRRLRRTGFYACAPRGRFSAYVADERRSRRACDGVGRDWSTQIAIRRGHKATARTRSPGPPLKATGCRPGRTRPQLGPVPRSLHGFKAHAGARSPRPLRPPPRRHRGAGQRDRRRPDRPAQLRAHHAGARDPAATPDRLAHRCTGGPRRYPRRCTSGARKKRMAITAETPPGQIASGRIRPLPTRLDSQPSSG